MRITLQVNVAAHERERSNYYKGVLWCSFVLCVVLVTFDVARCVGVRRFLGNRNIKGQKFGDSKVWLSALKLYHNEA